MVRCALCRRAKADERCCRCHSAGFVEVDISNHKSWTPLRHYQGTHTPDEVIRCAVTSSDVRTCLSAYSTICIRSVGQTIRAPTPYLEAKTASLQFGTTESLRTPLKRIPRWLKYVHFLRSGPPSTSRTFKMLSWSSVALPFSCHLIEGATHRQEEKVQEASLQSLLEARWRSLPD